MTTTETTKRYVQGRALHWQFGKAKTGTVQLGVRFVILDKNGNSTEERRLWYGAFTDAAAQCTIESARAMGWKGKELASLEAKTSGLDLNAVDLTLETDAEGNERVAWVNAPSVPMSEEASDEDLRRLEKQFGSLAR